jgi:hypothetical protein
VTGEPEPSPSGEIYEDDSVRETLAIEKRLLAAGYGTIPEVLRAGGDFDFKGATVAEVVDEALKYLMHQQTVDLAGARILATLGEVAVKAQAFDAILKLTRSER